MFEVYFYSFWCIFFLSFYFFRLRFENVAWPGSHAPTWYYSLQGLDCLPTQHICDITWVQTADLTRMCRCCYWPITYLRKETTAAFCSSFLSLTTWLVRRIFPRADDLVAAAFHCHHTSAQAAAFSCGQLTGPYIIVLLVRHLFVLYFANVLCRHLTCHFRYVHEVLIKSFKRCVHFCSSNIWWSHEGSWELLS